MLKNAAQSFVVKKNRAFGYLGLIETEETGKKSHVSSFFGNNSLMLEFHCDQEYSGEQGQNY